MAGNGLTYEVISWKNAIKNSAIYEDQVTRQCFTEFLWNFSCKDSIKCPTNGGQKSPAMAVVGQGTVGVVPRYMAWVLACC